MFRPTEYHDATFALRLAEQAGMAPMGIRSLAVRAAADAAGGTADRLHWLASLLESYAGDLRREHMTHRADDTARVAELLRLEAGTHA